MSSSTILCTQLQSAFAFLDQAIDQLTSDQLHWHPPGRANPIGATYAHILIGADAFISVLGGKAARHSEIQSRDIGVSELPPISEAGAFPPLLPTWFDWGRSVQIDLPKLREYGAEVQAICTGYLSALPDSAFNTDIDLSAAGFGSQSLAWLLSAGLIGHIQAHWGEIVCMKGLQGLQGFPV